MAVSASYTSSPRLSDADDRRHRLAASALSRESLIFLLFIPEERIGAIAYTWVDGESKAGAMALVFERENEKIMHAHVEGVPVDPGRDFDDWEVGFLRVEHGVPHQEAHVSFQHEGVSLDYTFRATTPAFCYHDNRDGCPAFLADNRFEQSGRVSGVLTIGDRVIPFDTTAHRDHSWGTRDWTAIHHYRWINIQGDGIALNFMHLDAIDQPTVHGYVDLDGEQAGIVSARFRIERDDELFIYTSVELELEDDHGRTTEVRSGPRDVAVAWPAGSVVSHDAASYGTVNGRRALMHVEEGWPPTFVQHRRAMAHADDDTEETRAALKVNRAIGVKEGDTAT
jgi:hypothetical protein